MSDWLLARADFALTGGGDRGLLKRWRRVLAGSLPALMGRAGKARVRLHETGSFTAWMRLPVERRPTRGRTRALEARLRDRLEAALLPVRGLVFDLRVRRFRRKAELALFGPSVAGPRPLAAYPEPDRA